MVLSESVGQNRALSELVKHSDKLSEFNLDVN